MRKVLKKVFHKRMLCLALIIGGIIMGCESSDSLILGDIKSEGKVLIKLYVLDGGEIEVADMSMFDPALEKGTKGIYANSIYLIKHPKGILLWDT